MFTPPDPAPAIQAAAFREKVRRARSTPMDVKLLNGVRLFDLNCEFMRAGIRVDFPEFTAEQVEREVRRRLAIARRLSDAGIYSVVSEHAE